MRYATICAIAAVVGSGIAARAAPACDPNQQQNDQTKELSRAKDYDGAAQNARTVIAAHPDDFRAHYELGWALLAKSTSNKDGGNFDAGLGELLTAESLLKTQDPACIKAKSWYSVYATLGYYDYLHGDLPNAEKSLGIARANFKNLDAEWQLRTLKYSAVLAFRKGDLKRAGEFSQQAVRAGAPDAAKLNQTVQTIQGDLH